jgi:hypothetical protein
MILKPSLVHALGLGLAAAGVAWSFSQWQGALRFVLAVAIALLYVVLVLPHLGIRVIDRVILQLRTIHWRHEQGCHHAFGGVPLQVTDDGRFTWVAADGLQRACGHREPEDVLAARHAGRWRRDRRGTLWLRVDTVVDVLAHAPGRQDPRTVRLRRYFEREVLFPAAERRRRTQTD